MAGPSKGVIWFQVLHISRQMAQPAVGTGSTVIHTLMRGIWQQGARERNQALA